VSDVIGTSISQYGNDFERVREDIVSGIREGFEEGLKEGIKTGFCDGIKDCLEVGFFNVDKAKIKSYEEILENAFENASRKSISSFIKNNTKKEYISNIDPVFKKYMEYSCTTLVEEIKNFKINLDRNSAKNLKIILSASKKKIAEEMGGIKDKIIEKLPTDIVFGSAIDGIQEGFQESFDDSIKICENRIDGEIENKVPSGAI